MSLFVFLVVAVILCSLILIVHGGENKMIKLFAVLSIVLEILLLLHAKGAIDLPSTLNPDRIIPCITGAFGLIGIFKLNERSIPLLIFFTSLLQFFMETGIIESIR